MTMKFESIFGYENNDFDYTTPPWGSAIGGDKTAVLGGYLYYLTGGPGGSTPGKGVYRTKNGTTWETVTITPAYGDRWNFQVLSFNGKLWVLGGDNGSAPLNDVWYSTDGATWTQATAAAGWSARWGFGACVYSGKMWVSGGGTNMGPSTAAADLWYSTNGSAWTQANATCTWGGRWGHILAPVSDGLVVIGGADDDAIQCNDGWKSTNLGVTWTEITPVVTGGTSLNTGVSPWTEGTLTDFTGRHLAAADYDVDGNLWMTGGLETSSIWPRGVWHTTDGTNWTAHTESPSVGAGGVDWWDRILPGYWGNLARFQERLMYFQGSGPDLPDDASYSYSWTGHVWGGSQPVAGTAASVSISGQSNVCLGCVTGFWSRMHNRTFLYNTAVTSGFATGGSESTLEDSLASFASTLGTNGYRLVIVREGWSVRWAEITGWISATKLTVGDWVEVGVGFGNFSVRSGDWYMVVPYTVVGYVASATPNTLTCETTWATAAIFPDSTVDGGLVGSRMTVLNTLTRAMQTRLITASDKTNAMLTVDRDWDFDPEDGDFFVIGGQAWKIRTPVLYPREGTYIRGKKFKLSFRDLGITPSVVVWVKVYASGSSYDAPSYKELIILDPFNTGSVSRLSRDWVNLPRYWGRGWQLEIAGLSLEQEIQVSRFEILVEER